jgi:hypothetical protein
MLFLFQQFFIPSYFFIGLALPGCHEGGRKKMKHEAVQVSRPPYTSILIFILVGHKFPLFSKLIS